VGYTLLMENGLLASHCHTWNAPGWDARLKLVTDRSVVDVDLFHDVASGTVDGQGWECRGGVHEFEAQHRGFLRAVTGNDPSLVRSTYADALRTFRVVEALNRRIYPLPLGPDAVEAGR
jgi:hypothetical protein